jgi:tetrahydromethanopterin S-methyltransferase subunit F
LLDTKCPAGQLQAPLMAVRIIGDAFGIIIAVFVLIIWLGIGTK